VKIVLDANVLISGILNPSGPSGRIVDFLRNGFLQLAIDDRIFSEYSDVLRRKYFLRYFEESEREDVVDYISKNSYYTSTRVVVHNMPDEGDVPFLEIALSENIPLVTGNLKHYPKRLTKGCIVLSPRQFISEYYADRPE
jgi:putative PIN family toxin of toxin-antitoxin system